jgi:hypothetical protein
MLFGLNDDLSILTTWQLLFRSFLADETEADIPAQSYRTQASAWFPRTHGHQKWP